MNPQSRQLDTECPICGTYCEADDVIPSGGLIHRVTQELVRQGHYYGTAEEQCEAAHKNAVGLLEAILR